MVKAIRAEPGDQVVVHHMDGAFLVETIHVVQADGTMHMVRRTLIRRYFGPTS